MTTRTTRTVGFVPGVWDMLHIGHLNILTRARSQCDFLIAGVVIDELVLAAKGTLPVVPFPERRQIVENLRIVDAAVRDESLDKLAMWDELRFNIVFKGDDWSGTPKGNRLERDAAALGVRVVYFPYTPDVSSTYRRRLLAQRAD
jgi:glycerol-3-phosphate cytidylyltransferase